MNEKNLERIVKKQFEESGYDHDYDELWNELEPRLPENKRRTIIWFFFFWVSIFKFSSFLF